MRTRAALDGCGGRNYYPGFQALIVRVLLAAHAAADDATGGLGTCARALELGGTPLWDAEVQRARAEFHFAIAADVAEVERELRSAEAVARRQAADGHLRRIEATRRRLGLGVSPAST